MDRKQAQGNLDFALKKALSYGAWTKDWKFIIPKEQAEALFKARFDYLASTQTTGA